MRVGKLRTALVSAATVLKDAVLAGEVGALAWLDEQAARRECGVEGELRLDDPTLREHVAGALRQLNEGEGSASRITRLLLLDEPPSIDAGEITDKGYVNQRAVLDSRSDAVERLFREPPDDAVIVPADA